MKAIYTALIALLCVATLTSCEDKKDGQVLDPLAKISIKPSTLPQSAPTKATYLGPVEVVRQATDIVMVSPQYPDEPYMNYGISEEQKELTTPKIMMWGMWVVYDNALSPTFIEAKDVILVTREDGNRSKPISDTLAYVPNAALRAAEAKIKAAYNAENYDLVYQLFDEAYRFTPINGADWLELKEQGLN